MSDIIDLIIKAREGDDDAFADIVSLYSPMLENVCHKFSFDYDEVFGDLCMALYRAASSYDIGQSEVTFGLYSRICVERAMLDMSRRTRNERCLDEDRDVEDIAADGDIASALIREEENESFRRDAREILSEYEYSVLIRWLSDDKTADIASALGVSAKSVDNAKARILKKLRDGLRPY
ncbi:MAG: sigma-70 family RNA polymerase sigma factor [Clostridia bacterium]|nr:sigma-70 family RNA polymerase sigma factor [Clostridia bacterium]